MINAIPISEISHTANNIIYSSEMFRSDASRVLFNSVFHLFPINFSWINKEGIVIGCNKNVLDLLSISHQNDFVGHHISKFISKAAWENSKEVMNTGLPVCKEEVHIKPGGEKCYFLSMKSPLKSDTGEVIGLTSIAMDISDRKQMEIELAKAKEMSEVASDAKTKFIYNMSHDLRTPFCGILSIAELLKNQETDPNKKDLLQTIEDSSQQLLNQINNTLNYLTIEGSQMTVIEKEFKLFDIVDEVYKQFLPAAKDKHIAFEVISNIPFSPFLMGDCDRLRHVLINIVSNAIKFTDTGHVRVMLDCHDVSERVCIVEIIIEDSGTGIPEDKFGVIFDRYTRLTPSYKGKYEGLGLGLAIVKHLLDDLDGQYQLSSVLEQGTSFKVLIPFKLSLFEKVRNLPDNR